MAKQPKDGQARVQAWLRHPVVAAVVAGLVLVYVIPATISWVRGQGVPALWDAVQASVAFVGTILGAGIPVWALLVTGVILAVAIRIRRWREARRTAAMARQLGEDFGPDEIQEVGKRLGEAADELLRRAIGGDLPHVILQFVATSGGQARPGLLEQYLSEQAFTPLRVQAEMDRLEAEGYLEVDRLSVAPTVTFTNKGRDAAIRLGYDDRNAN